MTARGSLQLFVHRNLKSKKKHSSNSLRMEYLKVLNTKASKDAETFPTHLQNIRPEDKTAKMCFSPKENEVLKYLPHISLNSLKKVAMKA